MELIHTENLVRLTLHDVVVAWAVHRLGCSLPDLVGAIRDLAAEKVDQFIHQQRLDTSTLSSRAMFCMLGSFAECKRSIIQARVVADLDQAKSAGVTLGRPRLLAETEAAARAALGAGTGIGKVSRQLGSGTSATQRVKAAVTAPAAA